MSFMKKLLLFFLASIISLLLSSCYNYEDINYAYNSGYDDGYKDGYEIGLDDGYDFGYDSGRIDAEIEGATP